MKAYRVDTGIDMDYYGKTGTEKAEYFFDKKEAEKRYEEGAYYCEETHITTTYANGESDVSVMSPQAYEWCLERAMANEKIELVKVKKNRFTLKEIEIK